MPSPFKFLSPYFFLGPRVCVCVCMISEWFCYYLNFKGSNTSIFFTLTRHFGVNGCYKTKHRPKKINTTRSKIFFINSKLIHCLLVTYFRIFIIRVFYFLKFINFCRSALRNVKCTFFFRTKVEEEEEKISGLNSYFLVKKVGHRYLFIRNHIKC